MWADPPTPGWGYGYGLGWRNPTRTRTLLYPAATGTQVRQPVTIPNTVLFQSIRLSRVTRQVDMAEIHRLSQVTEVVAGVEKSLVKKAKIHFFFEPYGSSHLSELNFT